MGCEDLGERFLIGNVHPGVQWFGLTYEANEPISLLVPYSIYISVAKFVEQVAERQETSK